MLTHIPTARLARPLVLSVALMFAACSRGDRLTQDSAMLRDLELANRGASAPTLNDAPPAAGARSGTSPSRTTTSRTTPATPPVTPPVTPTTNMGSIPSGSTIALLSGVRVCTNTHKATDTFTAKVSETITGSNGVMIPAGATATVQVTSVKRGTNVNDKPILGIAVQSITVDGKRYAVSSDVTSAEVVGVRVGGSGDAKKVIGGAVIGAIAGQIIGKDTKSTVIGAATGAVAGTAVAVVTGDKDGCIPDGGKIVIALTQAIAITRQ